MCNFRAVRRGADLLDRAWRLRVADGCGGWSRRWRGRGRALGFLMLSALFNSHLSDFMQGWIYVFAVPAARASYGDAAIAAR